jgi:hypothetical protein
MLGLARDVKVTKLNRRSGAMAVPASAALSSAVD